MTRSITSVSFSFRGGDPALYRGQIRCRNFVLVLGNHDPHSPDGTPEPQFASLFRSVHSLLRIKVCLSGQEQLIVLSQYAFRVWDQVHRGSWHLFGHSHGIPPSDPNSRSGDAGVDANGYRPISLDQVASIMAAKCFVPVDAHRERPAALRFGAHPESSNSSATRPAHGVPPPPSAPRIALVCADDPTLVPVRIGLWEVGVVPSCSICRRRGR
jgi:hypothetical protein